MSVTRGEWQENREAVPVDLDLDSEAMNILSPHGFLNCLWQVCRLRVGAGKFTAPVCGSWIFLPLGWASDVWHQKSKTF